VALGYAEMDSPTLSKQQTGDPSRQSASLRLDAMRADPQGTCADVELHTGGVVIRAHRSVLTTYEFFRNLFGRGSAFSEAATGRVEFEDVSPEALQMVVEYIYECPLDPTAGLPVLDEVWSFAAVHVMDDLVASVRDLLLEIATPDCILHLLRHAVQLQDAIAIETASKLVAQWLDKHDFYSDINDCGYDELMALKQWCPERKRPQWSSLVVAWMAQDPTERHIDAEMLLDSVDFASMSSEHLVMLNKAVGRQPESPIQRLERKLRDALLSRMENILDRRTTMLKSMDKMTIGTCSEDMCGTVACTFARDRLNAHKKTCTKCGRVRCEGVFTSSGNCVACGRRKLHVPSVSHDEMKSFASSLNKP
jgi:hypothetical protein